MTKDLNKKDLDIIQDECERYQNVYEHILDKTKQKTHELQDNQKLARSLTSQMVAEQREEEKQALQSDESVAHGLAKLRLQQSNALGNLLEQPYFARVVYHENNRDIEFKLGLASFPEERIIDWRKGPISKLYYDYEEGDEYDDEIAGRERQGEIKLKRGYRGRLHELTTIETKDQSYVKSHGQWNKQKKFQNVTFSLKEKEKIKELLKEQNESSFSRLEGEDGYLPQILSLITPEQFRLISSDIDKPIVIQGSAGTGKTTIALHRLAWVLFEDNSSAKEQNSLVVMFHKTLAKYVEHVLPDLGIQNVKIATYEDWAKDIITTSLKQKILFFDHDVTSAVAQFKASYKTFVLFEDFLKSFSKRDVSIEQVFIEFFGSKNFVEYLEKQDKAWNIQKYLDWQKRKGFFDTYDWAYLLHYVFVTKGYSAQKFPVELDHLVIDEAQDFTAAELKTLTQALNEKNQLCLAGDLGQKILENRDFGNWPELLEELGFVDTDVVNLNVAFRSTHQIYELAEYIRDPNVKDEDLQLVPRFGPEPQLTLCHNQADAVLQTKSWIEMIRSLNPNTIAAVICVDAMQAKQVYDALVKSSVHGIRLGTRQQFEFSPGVTITDIHQVKGLEFRSVLLFDPSEKNYPAIDIHAQNQLYVAITRAELRLDMVCFNSPSQLLPDFLIRNDQTQEINDEDAPLFDQPEKVTLLDEQK